VALRSGVSVPLHMSDYFWSVLCSDPVPSEHSSGDDGKDADSHESKFCAHVREGCARALRHGFNSTVPEVRANTLHYPGYD
jgi:hypothetical protein